MAQEKHYFTNSDYPLKNLSPEIIQSIIETSKEGTLLGQIRRYFDLKLTPSFYKDLPYSITDENCDLCASAVYEKPKRVSNSKNYSLHKICANCKHDFTDSCSCDTCVEVRAVEKKKKETEFKDAWVEYLEANYSNSYQLEELTLYDEINLAIIATKVDLDNPKEYLSFLHTPSRSYNRYYQHHSKKEYQFPDSIQSFAKQLINKEIIIPSIHSTSNVLLSSIDDDFVINVELKDRYHWEFNVYNKGTKLTPNSYLDYFFNDRKIKTSEKIILWRDIYKTLLADYVANQLENVLKNDIENYTIETITDLMIDDFSLSKAFFLIYCTARNTVFYENKYKANQQKVNTFFLNNITDLFNRHNKDKTAQDFNLPHAIQLSYYHQFIIHNVLDFNKTNYFYLSSDKLFPTDHLPEYPLSKEPLPEESSKEEPVKDIPSDVIYHDNDDDCPF